MGGSAQRLGGSACPGRIHVVSTPVPARALGAAALALVVSAATAGPDARLDRDPNNGAVIYERCAACHALAYDRTGPRHCGLFGRRAGSVPGFEYSASMKQSGIVWTEKNLDRFLTSPLTVVPGTAMGYAGIADAKERADLIAYLKQVNASPLCAK